MNDNENILRPTGFDNYIGQEKIIKQLNTHIQAERQRKGRGVKTNLDHVVFEGPAGLGKTSLAFVIAKELGVNLRIMQAGSIQHLGDLISNIMAIEEGDVFFIDEIHALKPNISEGLYSIMEDFRMDITPDGGEPINMTLPKFTLIGATTELGRLSKPLQDRFVHTYTLQRYSTDELASIIKRSATLLSCEIDEEATIALAKASRGTPRIANNLLKKSRNYAEVFNKNKISEHIATNSLMDAGINGVGMDDNDMKYLNALKEMEKPVGIKTLSGMLAMDMNTIENNIEAFLLENGLIEKHPRGRMLSNKALDFLKQKTKN